MMTLNHIRSKFGGDFFVPSFCTNIEDIPRKAQKTSRKLCRKNSGSSGSSVEIKTSRRCNNPRNKKSPTIRNSLKDKNIRECVFVNNSRAHNRSLRSSRTSNHYEEQEEQIETARNSSECSIETLKAVSLNFEFDQHGDYLAKNPSRNSVHDESKYSEASNIALERKYTEIFQKSSLPSAPIYKKQRDNTKKTSETPPHTNNIKNDDLKLILKTLKRVFKPSPVVSRESGETAKLYETIKTLQSEQEKFRSLINSQELQLNTFQSKYVKAENVIKSQKYEIQKLIHTNTQLESELHSNIDALKAQLEEKTNELANLPQTIKNVKIKAEKLSKQNCELIKRLQEVKYELSLTRAKLVEADQKRGTTLHKLKASEKDLKIFRNQNTILKTEKRTLIEELKRLKTHTEQLTERSVHKSCLSRRNAESFNNAFCRRKHLTLNFNPHEVETPRGM
ncbi:uncharacterized protein LOC129949481 [Eupeodes corollae]|uniref:uncharacterized protein LOC129949481 n=1 Tax=Eupeodes corollae TaxID=290404 RepID=UPI002492C77B|nr:uncharacterized protein LOC129949481 [Eupeodes corollae]